MSTRHSVRLVVLLSVTVIGLCIADAEAKTFLTASYVADEGRQIGLVFDRGDETLRAQAIFTLSGNQTIEVLLTNTTVGIPADGAFDNPADQILTSLYFDLGGPGLGATDPAITGGWAFVGDDSVGVGKKNSLVGGEDISNLWGFGNFKYTEPGMEMLAPNILTTLTAHASAFTGGNLKGPDYGAISGLNLLDGHNAGLASISDTVRLVVRVDQGLADLRSILSPDNYLPYVEFGSDADFFVADDLPPSPIPLPVPEPLTIFGIATALAGLAGYIRRR
jgi:hypothetical protein